MSSVGSWVIGDDELSAVPIVVDGVFLTTGTATIEYWRQNGASKEFLQGDFSTWSATYTTHACSLNAQHGFGHSLNVPASAVDYTIHWLIRHSVYGVVSGGQNHVTDGSGGGGGGSDGPLSVKLVPG